LVDTAIKAIVVRSANDVAVAIAEALGGTEGHFAELMTAKARALGMHDTFYHNASGLPDELQITTANDLAILARHLAYDFPQYFPYFSTPAFNFRGTTYVTHDNLIGRYDGADGIKTGYTGASGFNLVSSVVRNGTHIIGVVMGGTTARRRDTEMVRLLDDTFAAIGKNPLLVARATVPWQTLAQSAAAQPVIAGFQFGVGSSMPPTVNVGAAETLLHSSIARPGSEDEEAAESSPDPAYEPTAVTAKPAQPQPAAAKTVTLSPPPTKKATTAAPLPSANKIVLASLDSAPSRPSLAALPDAPELATSASEHAPKPRPKPSVPALVGGDDTDTTALQVGSNWTVQIGAYGNAMLAQSELAAYARKSADLLGQAARIVSPFESSEGHVIYRARFGPFDEGHARQVCQVLTQRGQICFATVAAR
jgi:D-alanyl-D-alanine carboxypeptidase